MRTQPVPRAPRRRMRSLPAAVAIALSVLGAGAAYGQQAVTGGIYGQVAAHETVVIDALNTGVKRTVAPKSNGKFSTSALNPGPYQVAVVRDGKVVSKSVVIVTAGVMSVAPNATVAPANVQTLAAVNVSASENNAKFTVNPIDTQTPQLVTQYSSGLIDDLPVSINPQAIALLQSNVNSEQQVTGSIQVNGATPGGNRYFLNGFDITNNGDNIGSFGVPPEAIANTAIIASGSDASWTNAIGGIVSVNIKQGSDQFKAGYDLKYVPPTSVLWHSRGRGSVNSLGEPFLYVPPATHYAPNITNVYWASGPLVKHKLFFYTLVSQKLPRDNTTFGATSKSNFTNNNYTGLANLTWDITNKQTADLIAYYNHGANFDHTHALNTPFDTNSIGQDTGWTTTDTSTKYLIGDYNWLINENLQVHVMAGVNYIRSTFNNSSLEAGGGADGIVCASQVDPITRVSTLLSPTNVCTAYNPSDSLTHGYKADVTWWHGINKLQFGVQNYLEESNEGFQTVGGGNWLYQDVPGAVLPNGETISTTDGNYVTRTFFSEVRTGHTTQRAAYLQDSLQVTPRLMLYAGARWLDSIYDVQQGINVLRLHSISPRVGFSWDAHGNSTLKIGGTLGEYTLPMPMDFSATIGQVDPYSNIYYTYTGIGPDGVPQGIQQIGAPAVFDTANPTPAAQKVSHNLKGMKSYGASLYAQQEFSSGWQGMVALTADTINRVIDQTCNNVPLVDVAQASGYPNFNISSADNSLCNYFNPGSDLVISRDFANNGKIETLTVPSNLIDVPGPSHHYLSLTLQATHKPTDAQPYFLNISYTFQREYGNYDGLLDLAHYNTGYPGDTYQYTYPDMMVGANGNLSDDIRNTVAASGTYYFKHGAMRGLSFGAVFRFQGGAPYSCLGTVPDATAPAAITRGPESHFCGGVVMPQGSLRMPSSWSLNLQAGYTWVINPSNKIDFSLQIFNVTNNQKPTTLDEQFDTGLFLSPTTLQTNPYYEAIESYQAPRSAMFIARYRFH